MNTVKFGSLIKNITRGISIKAADLEKITTYEETNIQYLKIRNIENGLITGDMTYLTGLEERYEKYCLKDKNLILTKAGFPPKILVAEIKDDKTILASGNFYIISLFTDKVDPYYLAAYFNSDKGKLALANIAIGEVIPTLTLTELKNLEIPLPSMEEQNQVGKKYRDVLDEITKAKENFDKAVTKLSNLI